MGTGSGFSSSLKGGVRDAVGVVDVGMRGGSSGVVGRHVWCVVVGV